MANYYTLLTPAGLAKVTNAQLTNEKVEITQVAVGDANGTGYKPSGTETTLKREVWRGGVASIEIDALNPNWIVVEAIVPATVGGFTMREVALFDTAGDMIAIGNYPDTYKPVANDGSTMDLALRTIIEVNNAESVTLKIDPNVIVASRAYVDGKVAGVSTDLTALDARVTTHLDKYATTQDLTINVTSSQSLHTELNKLQMRIDHTININLAPGTYNETVYFEGRVGKGRILINGAKSVASTHKLNQLLFFSNTIPIAVSGVDFTSTDGAGVYVENCTDVILNKCKCVTSSTTQNAITFIFSKGTVQGCELSNRAMAIYAGNSSTVTSSGNSGTNNQMGLVAEFTSTIGKAAVQPNGATAEFKQNGGDIR